VLQNDAVGKGTDKRHPVNAVPIKSTKYSDFQVLLWPELSKATAPRVTVAPPSCNGVRPSPRNRYPQPAANMGVKKVRLESAVRLPFEAL